MIEILFGVAVGASSMWFFNRFKSSLLIFKKKAESKIEKALEEDL
jgi:hypothetical protein